MIFSVLGMKAGLFTGHDPTAGRVQEVFFFFSSHGSGRVGWDRVG